MATDRSVSRALLSDTLDSDKIGLKSELEFLRSLAEILEPLDGGPGDVRRALCAISTMRRVLSKAPRSENAPTPCPWTPDDDGVYQTGCGEAFTFIDSGPKENGMKFCCYCGGTMQERRVERGGRAATQSDTPEGP